MKLKSRKRKALKRAMLIISVVIAILAAGASFIQATNCMTADKTFWISISIFVLSVEYVFLFMYANEEFIDEAWKKEYYEELYYEDTEDGDIE